MPTPIHVLIVRSGSRHCALVSSDVIETMRPLPTRPMGGAPAFVRGLAVIRGAPVPVVELAGLLQGAEGESHGSERRESRYVSLRVKERVVALAVDEVIGLRKLDSSALEELPPLLQEGAGGAVSAMGMLDMQLLLLLRAARLIPEDAWGEWAAPAV
jgi:purine-binding chemotaxis protein CheW